MHCPPHDPAAHLGIGGARWIVDWCTEGPKRQVVALLGGPMLMDWLVNSACQDPGPLQSESEKALVQLMGSGRALSNVGGLGSGGDWYWKV
jgi:hypothetical protein